MPQPCYWYCCRLGYIDRVWWLEPSIPYRARTAIVLPRPNLGAKPLVVTMALSRIVSETQWDTGWKSQIIGTPPLFGAPSEFHSRVSCGKTKMMGPPGDENSLMVSLAVSIQYINVTDGRTDRQTDGHRTTAKTALFTASRYRNVLDPH